MPRRKKAIAPKEMLHRIDAAIRDSNTNTAQLLKLQARRERLLKQMGVEAAPVAVNDDTHELVLKLEEAQMENYVSPSKKLAAQLVEEAKLTETKTESAVSDAVEVIWQRVRRMKADGHIDATTLGDAMVNIFRLRAELQQQLKGLVAIQPKKAGPFIKFADV
jgi:hypothetical protein